MSASRARAALPEILDRVSAGEEVTITRHGRAIAVVVSPQALPPGRPSSRSARGVDRGGSLHHQQCVGLLEGHRRDRRDLSLRPARSRRWVDPRSPQMARPRNINRSASAVVSGEWLSYGSATLSATAAGRCRSPGLPLRQTECRGKVLHVPGVEVGDDRDQLLGVHVGVVVVHDLGHPRMLGERVENESVVRA